MADIELVIKIPEDEYNEYKQGKGSILYPHKYIHNGTPLPKGHGRLIDADYLRNVALLHNWHGNDKNYVPYSDRKGYRLREREVDEAILNAPTIIEADKEESK